MTDQAIPEISTTVRNFGVWAVALVVGASGGLASYEYRVPATENRIVELQHDIHIIERDLAQCLRDVEVAKERHKGYQRRLMRLEDIVGVALGNLEKNAVPVKTTKSLKLHK